MSDETPQQPTDPRFGEFAPDEEAVDHRDNPEDRDPGPEIPVADWVPTPVFDSSDYLDREAPSYEGDAAEEEQPPGQGQGEGEGREAGQREPGDRER